MNVTIEYGEATTSTPLQGAELASAPVTEQKFQVPNEDDGEMELPSRAIKSNASGGSSRQVFNTMQLRRIFKSLLRRRRLPLRKKKCEKQPSEFRSSCRRVHVVPAKSGQLHEESHGTAAADGRKSDHDPELGLDATDVASAASTSYALGRVLPNTPKDASDDLTVYSWMVVAATAPRVSTRRAILCISITIVFPLAVNCMALAILYQAVFPSCARHEDCVKSLGPRTLCMPTYGRLAPSSLTPGRCHSCDKFDLWLDGRDFWSPYSNIRRGGAEMLSAAGTISCPYCGPGRTWVDSGVAHCKQSSGEVSCKFLYDIASNLHHFPLFLVVACLAVWAMSAADELADASKCIRILQDRTHGTPNKYRREAILLLGRMAFLWRVGLMGSFGAGAWALITSGGLQPSNILLNLVGLSFLINIDDVVPSLLLKPQSRGRILASLRDASSPGEAAGPEWAWNRVFLVYIITGVTFGVARPFFVAQLISGLEPRDISCMRAGVDNFSLLFLFPTFLFSAVFYYLLVWQRTSTQKMRTACFTGVIFVVFVFGCGNVMNGMLL
eukprot:GEMP01001839.1.p1 GENE.GEMP01001839.1~~GEMP01001839.1.p1  ORF type:complete len:555 (-),score=104.23 GEMP01001839.1:3274-4938(-)